MHRSSLLTRSRNIFAGLLLFTVALPPQVDAQLVGTLPGSVSVDNKGAANYSVPLSIAPGRGGMQPSLSLNYNSASGNGPLGIGFSLSTGFPQAITRGRSILVRDGETRGVNFDANDKFYLDGKRLIYTGGGSGYGSPGSTYRTEVDSFVTVSTSGAGSNIETFTVTDKSGTVMTFGKYASVTDGYQVGAYDINGNGPIEVGEVDTLAYAYALKHVQDVVGNCVDFTYVTANDGEYQVSQIDYTANVTPGSSISAAERVRFIYDVSYVAGVIARADQPTSYIANRRFYKKKRLDQIVAESNVASSWVTTSSYALTYNYSPNYGPTRLTSLQGSFADPTTQALQTVPATSFTWDDKTWSYTTVASSMMTSAQPEGSGFGDVNGDGRDDFIDGSGSSTIMVSLGTATGFAAPVSWIGTSGLWTGPAGMFRICDINGDGKKDIINGAMSALVSTGSSFTSLSGGGTPTIIHTFTTEFQDPGASTTFFATREQDGTTKRITTGDFNGDGRDDVMIHRYDGKLLVLQSTGTGFTALPLVDVGANSLSGTPSWEHFSFRFLGFNISQNFSVTMMPCELNGDGRTDYAWVESVQAWDTIYSVQGTAETAHGGKVLFAVTSLPGGGFSQKTLVTQYGWGVNAYSIIPLRQTSYTIMPGDVNGDGLTDFTTLTPADQVAGDGGWSWHQQRLLRQETKISMGSNAEPKFRTTDNNPLPSVTIAGQQVRPWFDKIAMGEWVNDRYDSIGQFVNPSSQRPIFLAAGTSSSSDNVTMTDVNSDGRADYVWYADFGGTGGWYAMYSLGESFSAPVAVPLGWIPTAKLPSGAMSMTISSRSAMDLNGDGLQDYTYVQAPFDSRPGISGLHISQGKPGDRISGITNGLGGTTTISYRPISDDAIYTAGASVVFPIRELRNATYVVSDIYKDTGSATAAQFSYQYSGNRLDLSGRGSLGFHSFVTLDRQTNLFKYQFLAQSFPMTGLTHREETYRWWNASGQDKFRFISSHDNTVVFDKVSTSGGLTLWPFISKAVESRWEDSATAHFGFSSTTVNSQPENLFAQAKPAGAHITITAQSKFDSQSSPQLTLPGVSGYNPSDTNGSGQNTVVGTTSFATFSGLPGNINNGNLTNLSTDYGSGYTESVTTTYKAGSLTGLVDTVTTTVVSPGYGSETAPIKRYNYWGATPLVSDETIDATDNALDLKTTYTRDTRGRVTNTQVTNTTATGVQAIGDYSVSSVPTPASNFDDKWDLPKVTQNNYGHTTTTVFHPFLGLPTSVTDVNNAQITTTYDALGRTVSVNDVLRNRETTSAFVWDATQTVAPPSGVTGITLTSSYKVTTTTTVQPTVAAYFDRLGRVIRTVKTGFNEQQTITDNVYNNLGQLVATTLPYLSTGTPLWTKTTYDDLGRVATVTAPNGTVTTNTYKGRATAVSVDAPSLGGVDPAAQVNTTVVDAKGRTVSVWNADNVPSFTDTLGTTTTGSSITFALDGFGRMRTTTLKGQTQTITATYDALGRQLTLNDPDKGLWSYLNNALGQVVEQTDARSNVTTSAFDRLGRPLSRTTIGNSSTETASFYYYDANSSNPNTVAKGTQGWIGAPEREEAAATGSFPTTNLHYYNAKGLSHLELAQTDGKWFYTYSDYDTYSRVRQVRHYWKPSGAEAPGTQPYLWQDFGYIYSYDAKSYLTGLTDSLGRSWWDTPSYDYLDRVTSVRKGSGLTTTRTYRAEDGVLTGITTGSVQSLGFNFDGLGNLTSRTDGIVSGGESLTYDTLNRLKTSKQGTMNYADNGNILTKPDVAGTASVTYTYDSTHLHAVATAFGYAMTYDANGNLLTRSKAGDFSTVKWAGFDKPRWMAKTTSALSVTAQAASGSEFHYNAGRSRVMQLEFSEATSSGPTKYNRKRTYALGSTLELNYTTPTPALSPAWTLDTVRIYVPGPDGIIGAREFRPASGGTEKALVYHYDHLGSITAITDYGTTAVSVATGSKTGRYSEDAWGQRRNPTTWSGAPTASTDDGGFDSLTPRGFTGHEMLDALGLVHMNGRIYDPLLGRFLSADIVVQAPMSLQSYNRYSYVMNNPLTLVDPSGFIFGTPLSTREYFGSVLSGLGQGGVEVASSFRRSAEGLGTMAGYLSVDPIGTVTAAHDQLTTNLANGYELAASTTVSDVSRDLSNAGSMYANNENGFRDEVNDMTTGTAITLAAGEALKPIEAAIKSKAGDLLKRLDNAAPETRAAPEVQEQASLQRQPEQQQAQLSQSSGPSAAEQKAITKIENASKHVDDKHISAATGDQMGSPIPRKGGGAWDHATEVGDAMRGLRNASDKLQNSADPSAIEAVKRAQEILKKAEDAFKGAGI